MSTDLQTTMTQEMQQLDQAHLWHPLTQHQPYQMGFAPLIITGGSRCTVKDMNGKEYLDVAAGLWCVNVGYGRDEIAYAALEQMQTLAYYPLTQSHPKAIHLGAKLAEYLPNNPHVYFSNSGSEANETAFKMVRQYWRQKGFASKYKIISRHRGYHGSTMGALSATGQSERTRDYEPLVPGFSQAAAPYCFRCSFHMEYPTCQMQCAEDFERRIQIEGAENVAAIIVEPITAGGGVLVPPVDYLRRVREIADKYHLLLIVDEVVTGFGRTGAMFAHTDYGVRADVVTMAKGLASGYMPIGATAVSDAIFEAFLGEPESGTHLRHVNTFSGHPVACAVALKNLEIIEREDLVSHSRRMGEYLISQLQLRLAAHRMVGNIRGRGLLVGVEIIDAIDGSPVQDATMKSIAANLVNRGILAGKTTDIEAGHNNVLIFAPPLIITESEIDCLCDAVKSALSQI